MNHSLDKIPVIDIAKLDGERYFQSLLEEAQYKGLLANSEVERLQYECLTLLADKTERYNAGDSSSIRVEKAQDIMVSILFTIGLWLKTYPNPDDAVSALRQNAINEIYQKGRKRIGTLLATTKAIHTKLRSQLIDTQNSFYRDTLVNGILGFFKLYDPDYAAQEIHITADYPLFNPLPKLAGIEFIKAYVEAAYLENQFCAYFSAEDIHHLLCGYAEDYPRLLINIYEPVLTAAVGCILAGSDYSRLDVTQPGADFLYRTFSGRSKNEILESITKAVNELTRRLKFPQQLTRYIQNSLPLLAGSIETSAKEHLLNRVFFTPSYPENKPKIIFSAGTKMDDERYRKIIAEISSCRHFQDKLAMIKRSVHSLIDLEDVLLDAELTGEEIQSVLRELSFPEITALYQKYQPMFDREVFELREPEQLLRVSLQNYISALPKAQQNIIEQASQAMEAE